mgnify:CR=1 FL=1|tara:strand:- start:60 stop:743 length:684 start_codon:yes stop_codon:yes gene_type:complete
MSITRAQIARQLLAEGGVSLDDAKMMAPPGEFLAYINPKEANMLKAAGGSGIMTAMGIPSFVDFTDTSQGITATDTFSAAGGGGGVSEDDQEDDNARMMQAMGLVEQPPVNPFEDIEDDNTRMMQRNNIFNRRGPPRNVGDVLVNLGMYAFGKKNPKVMAAIEMGKTIKDVYNILQEPKFKDTLSLSPMEERELATLQTGKEVGLNTPIQNQRLEELESKKAEEEQK